MIIPVLNGARTLGVQLQALADQLDAPPFEVLVSDNGSTDETRDVAAAFADRLDLRLIDASAIRGPSYARNLAAPAARSAALLFCDADDRVAPTWVWALCDALSCNGLATGPVIYVDPGRLSGSLTVPAQLPCGPRRYLDQREFATSNNLGVRADVFHGLSGFDRQFTCVEDADFTIRAQVHGHSLAWAQHAVVFNGRRSSLAEAARQFFRYGREDALLFKKLRGNGLVQRPAWTSLRPYLVLAATSYRVLFPARRWSWVINAAQRAGRIVGSVRFRVLCL